MNQDSSFPPMLPPSTELGALLFAILPCLKESYRPLASFAYHMIELSKLRTLPPMPPLSGISGVETLISDKDGVFRSLSFYGRMFRMPLLSTLASLLQTMQFYQAYKDIIPGLFSAASGGTSDLFSSLGGLSPDLLSSLFSGFGGFGAISNIFSNSGENTTESPVEESSEASVQSSTGGGSAPITDDIFAPGTDDAANSSIDSFFTPNTDDSSSSVADEISDSVSAPDTDTFTSSQEAKTDSIDLYDSLYPLLTPEQKEIYDRLMNTD